VRTAMLGVGQGMAEVMTLQARMGAVLVMAVRRVHKDDVSLARPGRNGLGADATSGLFGLAGGRTVGARRARGRGASSASAAGARGAGACRKAGAWLSPPSASRRTRLRRSERGAS